MDCSIQQVANSDKCYGCGACAAICPYDSIHLLMNDEGFYYPHIDLSRCKQCGICSISCPCLNEPTLTNRIFPPVSYAGWNRIESTRLKSSSGGIFSALADKILSENGVVSGAVFDSDFHCHHILSSCTDGVTRMRGSKYVQSYIAENHFREIRKFLVRGKIVLFTGTPCQVAGLRNFLSEKYEHLICCDLLCHGVPSQMWLNKYLSAQHKRKYPIVGFSFRDKTLGWSNFQTAVEWADGFVRLVKNKNNPFMISYLKNYSLRESCYLCPYASDVRQGDITLGDYWGISEQYPEYSEDKKGISLIIINSSLGERFIKSCGETIFITETNMEYAKKGNVVLSRPFERPQQRSSFYKDIMRLTYDEFCRIYHLSSPSIMTRIIQKVFKFISKLTT